MVKLEELLRARYPLRFQFPIKILLKVTFKESLKESQYLSCGSQFRISKIEFQFLLHAVLPKACSSRQSIESWNSLFINLFYMSLNFRNLILLLCENEKLPDTYSKAPWSMCILEIPKRISLTEYSHTIVAWWLSGIRLGYFYGYCEGLVSK